jgi:8-oxo-dGTP diphosphatase
LIDIHQYEKQLSEEYHPEWFLLDEMPDLIFDHEQMVKLALKQLRYKAALHPTAVSATAREIYHPSITGFI